VRRAPKAEIWQYSGAGNPPPKPKDYSGPVGYYAALQSVKKAGAHGQAFGYKTPNADALGWRIGRLKGLLCYCVVARFLAA